MKPFYRSYERQCDKCAGRHNELAECSERYLDFWGEYFALYPANGADERMNRMRKFHARRNAQLERQL